MATALNAHDSAASVMKVTINADGTWAQEVFAFGGSNNAEVAADGSIVTSQNVATIEMDQLRRQESAMAKAG